VVVCAVLGFQQVALKTSSADTFSLYDGTARPGVGLGVLFALEYLCVGEGLRFTSASRMVIFLYTAPLFSALFLHFLREDERLRLAQWCGMFLAFMGITLTFAFTISEANASSNLMWWGDILGLLGGLAWGLSTVLVRTSALASAAPAKTLLYQLAMATALLTVLAIVLKQSAFQLSPYLMGNLLFQGVVISFLSFLVWFTLLKRYVAAQLGVLAFMSPLFGVAFGVLLLNEPLEWHFVFGLSLVMVGILFVSADQLLIKTLSDSSTQ